MRRQSFGCLVWQERCSQRRKAALPEEAYRLRRGQLSMDFSSVKSVSRITPWLSPGPVAFVRLRFEPGLLKAIRRSGHWAEGEDVWLTNLYPNNQPLLIRRARDDREGEDEWQWVIGHRPNTCLTCWPVELVGEFSGHNMFIPRVGRDVRPSYKHIHDKRWGTLLCKMASP